MSIHFTVIIGSLLNLRIRGKIHGGIRGKGMESIGSSKTTRLFIHCHREYRD